MVNDKEILPKGCITRHCAETLAFPGVLVLVDLPFRRKRHAARSSAKTNNPTKPAIMFAPVPALCSVTRSCVAASPS
jgi:hypothetical protein